MKRLTEKDYRQLRENCQVIEKDHHGEKVLHLRNGHFLKLFRRKRLLTSALFKPYAKRFADNAHRLQQRGIPTVDIIGVYRIPAIARTAVHYHPLTGETLRRYLTSCPGPQRQQLASELGHFIAKLHNSGIYFRSLHLGNILTDNGRLGLIDIADMRCANRSLGLHARLRNFHHLARYRRDIAQLGNSAAIMATTYNKSANTPDRFRLKLDAILSGT